MRQRKTGGRFCLPHLPVAPSFASCLLALLLTACGSAAYRAPIEAPRNAPPRAESPRPSAAAPLASASRAGTMVPTPQYVLKRGGGFYKDDGPGDLIPDNLDQIPDAEPKWEPIHKPATRPYVVLGKEYQPNATVQPYRARGIASWYGRKFHGQKTSIGEPYDMFAMTAAHPTLVLPSYVRVTNAQTGKSVVVRVTDRGPFHADRIIDLSYAAAWKLGLIGNGSGEVIVEAIVPSGVADATTLAAARVPAPVERDELVALIDRMGREESTPAAPVKGIFLQLGAFTNADNAEMLRRKLAGELDWLAEPLRIHSDGSIHRLRAGPYGNRAEAEKTAERIRIALGYRPTVVSR